MVVPELASVVVEPLLLEQVPGARMVQLWIVDDNEPGVAGEVGPDVVVMGVVAELVDDQIVRIAPSLPDEVVRVEDPFGARRGRGLDKPVDREVAVEERQQFGVIGGDAGADRRQRRKPRQS